MGVGVGVGKGIVSIERCSQTLSMSLTKGVGKQIHV